MRKNSVVFPWQLVSEDNVIKKKKKVFQNNSTVCSNYIKIVLIVLGIRMSAAVCTM